MITPGEFARSLTGVFLALSVGGLTLDDGELVRAAYLAMELTLWSVLVPLASVSLVTGVLQGLGTSWGLFRHYWVVAKLVLTVVATAVLLLYTRTIGHFADIAAAASDLDGLRNPSPLLHAGLGVLVLLTTTTLAIFKPRGVTRYGWRKQREMRAAPQS